MKKLIVFVFLCLISIVYAKTQDVQDKKQVSEKSADENKDSAGKNLDVETPEIKVKKMSNEMTAVFKKLTIKLKNTDSDTAAAAVINEFNAVMRSYDKKAKAIKAEYPDYNFSQQNEKFEEENKRMEEAMFQLLEVIAKLVEKYEDSEVFKKAIEEIGSSVSYAETQE